MCPVQTVTHVSGRSLIVNFSVSITEARKAFILDPGLTLLSRAQHFQGMNCGPKLQTEFGADVLERKLAGV
jgi:hypothetical protein